VENLPKTVTSAALPLHLTAAQRDTLACFTQLLTCGAPDAAGDVTTLARLCDERLAPLEPHKRRELGQALDLLGGRLGVALGIGSFARFADLGAEEQARCFAAWGCSRIPPLRAASQAIRKLVLSTHYAQPEVAAAVGSAGPFRLRGARYPWEGPLGDAFVPADGSASPIATGPVHLPPELPPDPVPRGVIRGVDLVADQHRSADVIVIGSGAGGAVAAARLAEAGFDVAMVEGGGWHTRSDFTEDDVGLADRLLAEAGLRATDDGSVTLVQGETAGGSTTVNWMIMLRTPDFVLEQWGREAGVTGMSPAEMAPVFDEIERDVHAALVPDEAHSANNRLLLDGARALGWRARGGRINAKGCVRCGFCTVGCRHDAKQSALVTWIPRALAAGAVLHTDARVTRIELRERDTGRGLPPRKRVHAEVRAAAGATRALTIDAPIVIVAAGAVGTPVILERSGLGGGGVGHFLRLHPVAMTTGVYDRDIAASTGVPLTTVCDEHLQWEGTDYGFWIETPPMPAWFTAAVIPEFGPAHAARMRDFNRLGTLIGLTRDGADRLRSSGRVTVDRRGQTSIRWRLLPEDARRVRASIGAMAQLHFAAGAREVFTGHAVPRVARSAREVASLMEAPIGPNQLPLFSAHVNGSCRMGTDPRRSGATPDGQRHGVRGLYISDGSLLPTALGVNPQETIMAVARVLTDRIIARHDDVRRAGGAGARPPMAAGYPGTENREAMDA
jgi:choline dehydrogenase-like flavoprotein